MIKSAELAELDDDELDNRLAQSRHELFNLRFQLATGRLDNSARISEVKRDVARILTEMRARELSYFAEPDAIPQRSEQRQDRTAALAVESGQDQAGSEKSGSIEKRGGAGDESAKAAGSSPREEYGELAAGGDSATSVVGEPIDDDVTGDAETGDESGAGEAGLEVVDD